MSVSHKDDMLIDSIKDSSVDENETLQVSSKETGNDNDNTATIETAKTKEETTSKPAAMARNLYFTI